MVVGDFAHLGREQLLILFTGKLTTNDQVWSDSIFGNFPNPDSAASFVVTDLEQFSTTTETKVTKQVLYQ